MANVFDQFDEQPKRGYRYSEGPSLNSNDPELLRIETAGTRDSKTAAEPNPFDQFDQPAEATGLERFMAVPAAFNKMVTSYLPGIPVDTVANILDLGKAGIGYTTSKITGNAPPVWTEPFDRRQVVGSSEWIADRINSGADTLGVRSPINNPAPQDRTARILYSTGMLGGSAVVPNPRARIGAVDQLRNVGMGSLGGVSSGVTAEYSPEWAGVAGMAPQFGKTVIASGTKRVMRGGEEGRRRTEQRIQDFKNAGVDQPSAGLATGNRAAQGAENLLSLTPGSVSVFERSKQRMIDGMQNRSNQIRNDISPVYGAVEAGAAIQKDLKGAFKKRINQTQGKLSDRVLKAIGPNHFTTVDNAISVSKRMSSPIPGAEATSTPLINKRIADISRNLSQDIVGTPIVGNPLMNEPMRYKRFDGVVSDTPPGIPFSALKALRTDIGKEATSSAIMGTPEQGQFKRLYGALSDDMKTAVNAADRKNAGVEVGPLLPSQQPGAVALNRSNTYYSRGMNRADELNQLANRSTPEGAYRSVANSLNSGPTVWQRLRSAVTPETRRTVVATVFDDMGKATPGQQGADGNTWSSRTFLTNWNKMDPQTRTELFKRLPGGDLHGQNLDAIAKAADMIGDSSKVWANPSGTGAALAARGTFGAIGIGALYEPVIAAGTAASLLTGHAAARLLTSPIFVNWLAKAPKSNPDKMQSYAQRLVINAQMAKDAQLQQDVAAYLQSIEDAGK